MAKKKSKAKKQASRKAQVKAKVKVTSVTKSSGNTSVKAKSKARTKAENKIKAQRKPAFQGASKKGRLKSHSKKNQLKASLKSKNLKSSTSVGPTKNQAHSFNFSPLGDRLLVKVIPTEAVTKGGIIIPDSVTSSEVQGYLKAQVVAVGPGRKNKKGNVVPTQVLKGDTVLFPKYAGEKIEIDGVTHFIVRESDLLGVAP